MTNGAEKAMEEWKAKGVEVELVVTDAGDTDMSKQVSDVEDIYAMGVDGLLIFPAAGSKLMSDPIKNLYNKNKIPVVVTDIGLSDAEWASFIITDNYLGGKMLGELVARNVPKGAKVVTFDCNPAAENCIARQKGFEEAAAAAGLTVLPEKTLPLTLEDGRRLTEDTLTAVPDIAAIFHISQLSAQGSVAALTAMGNKSTKVVAFDIDAPSLQMVKDGKILGPGRAGPLQHRLRRHEPDADLPHRRQDHRQRGHPAAGGLQGERLDLRRQPAGQAVRASFPGRDTGGSRPARAAGALFRRNPSGAVSTMSVANETVLRCRSITKSFKGVQALAGVDFDILRGQVHGLIGENGAGKSTLMKILSGAYTADSGEVLIDGRPVHVRDTQDAIGRGIVTIYQDSDLIPTLSVAENIHLNHEPLRRPTPLIDRERLLARTRELLAAFRLDVPPAAMVRDLPSDQQKMVQIVKAVSRDAKVLLMDEPTSSLTRHEVDLILDFVRSLAARGVGVVFISHYLAEVFRVCDRITILREGQVVRSVDDPRHHPARGDPADDRADHRRRPGAAPRRSRSGSASPCAGSTSAAG